MLDWAMPDSAVLCHAVLFRTMQGCAVPCCAVCSVPVCMPAVQTTCLAPLGPSPHWQGPYRAVGQALEVIPRTLAQNCGANVIRTLTKLRAKHAEEPGCTFGIDGAPLHQRLRAAQANSCGHAINGW